MIESIRPNQKVLAAKETHWKSECEAFTRYQGSLQSFCRERKLNYHTFCYWRSKLGRRESKAKQSTDVQIPVLIARGPEKTTAIEINFSGMMIKIPESISPEYVARMLMSLQAGTGTC